jgi:hypothetical protein
MRRRLGARVGFGHEPPRRSDIRENFGRSCEPFHNPVVFTRDKLIAVKTTIGIDGAQRRTTMLTKIMLALALLVAALATIPAVGAWRDSGQAGLNYSDRAGPVGGSAGGNLVPIW